ncbi:hypothetical protein NMY22_g18836 [Coprinellus aureogranulatus]|nr:hypothetical protein NMY22_g18836 [Coprinellus aureogranulatus]
MPALETAPHGTMGNGFSLFNRIPVSSSELARSNQVKALACSRHLPATIPHPVTIAEGGGLTITPMSSYFQNAQKVVFQGTIVNADKYIHGGSTTKDPLECQ